MNSYVVGLFFYYLFIFIKMRFYNNPSISTLQQILLLTIVIVAIMEYLVINFIIIINCLVKYLQEDGIDTFTVIKFLEISEQILSPTSTLSVSLGMLYLFYSQRRIRKSTSSESLLRALNEIRQDPSSFITQNAMTSGNHSKKFSTSY